MADTIFADADIPSSQPTDVNATRSVGMKAQESASGKACTKGRVFIPTAGVPVVAKWQLWDFTGPSLLSEFDLTTLVSPTLGAYNEFAITPVALTANHDYIVTFFMDGTGHYPFTDAGTLPKVRGICTASTGIYRLNGLSTDAPNTTYAGWFHADWVVEDASSDQSIAWGLASEVDSAFAVGVNVTVPWGQAVERDTAFAVGSNLTVPWGQAVERDSAFPIGHTGGAMTASAGDSVTTLLNVLAGTMVNGVPSVTAAEAARIWASAYAGATEVAALNTEAGNSLPNWRALQGVANQIAGTTDLSLHDALLKIING